MTLACSMHEGAEKCLRDCYVENINERKNLRALDVDGKTVLNLVLNKCNVRVWTAFS